MAGKTLFTQIVVNAKDNTKSVLKSIVKGVALVGTAVASIFAANIFKKSIDSAETLERQMGVLEAVILSTGGAAGLTAQEIDEMARRLDEATLGSAEGFRKAAGSLLTFKSVGTDSFESVLKLAQDLAANGIGNLQSNVIQLGKALEDPVNGINSLRRAGVTFSDSQRELIKRLAETGQAAQAQKLILKELEGQVGGAGSGAGGGLSGAIDLVGKRFTDFTELLGKGMLPVLTEANKKFAEFLKRVTNSGAVEDLGRSIASAFDKGIIAFTQFIEAVNFQAVITSINSFVSVVGWAVGVVVNFGREIAIVAAIAAAAKFVGFTKSIASLGAQALIGAASVGKLSKSITVSGIAVIASTAAYAGLAAAVLDIVDKYGQLKKAQLEQSQAQKALEKNTAVRLAILTKESEELEINTEGIERNITALVDAILAKRDEIEASKQSAEANRDYGADVEAASDAVKQAAIENEALSKAFGLTGVNIVELSNDVKGITDDFAAWQQTTSGVKNGLSALIDGDLEQGFKNLQVAISSGINATDEAKAALQSYAEEGIRRVGIDIDKIIDKSDKFAAAQITAFNQAREVYGLSGRELEKYIQQMLTLARTPQELSALVNSLTDQGIKIRGNSGLTKTLTDTIRRMGLTGDEAIAFAAKLGVYLQDNIDKQQLLNDEIANQNQLAAKQNQILADQNAELQQQQDIESGNNNSPAATFSDRTGISLISPEGQKKISQLPADLRKEFEKALDRLIDQINIDLASGSNKNNAQKRPQDRVAELLFSFIKKAERAGKNKNESSGGSEPTTQQFIRESSDQIRQLADVSKVSADSVNLIRQSVQQASEDASKVSQVVSDYIASQQVQLPQIKIEIVKNTESFTINADSQNDANKLIDLLENQSRRSA